MNQLQNKSFEEALVRYREKWDKIKDPCVVYDFPIPDVSCKELLARDMVYEMTDPAGCYGSVKMIGSAVKLSETPARQELFPPRKGEHNAEYLKAVGYSDEQIAEFEKNGII